MKRLGSHIILNEEEAKRFVATALRWALAEYNIADDEYWSGDLKQAFNIDIFMGRLWHEVLKGDGYEKFLRFLEGPS